MVKLAMIQFKIKQDDLGKRLDLFLIENSQDVSRSQIQNQIKAGLILVNNANVKTGYLLKEDDKITWKKAESETTEIKAINLEIPIVYQDEYLAVINKPEGLVVHPASSYEGPTLVHGLLHEIDHLSSLNGEYRAGIVHRLDKDTSGLLIIAKDDKTHAILSDCLKKHAITRKYIALVHGVVKEDEGIINAPIKRHLKDRLKMSVVKDGKEAITNFRVIERFDKMTLLELKLETGRTHQIRVHLQFIKHPVVGDPTYGYKSDKVETGQYLHAYQLSFIHPYQKEKITQTVDLPDSFKNCLKKLKSNFVL